MSIPTSKNEITLNDFTIRKDDSDKPFIFECEGQESKSYKFKKDLVKRIKKHINTEDNKEALKIVNEKLGIVKKEKVVKQNQPKQPTIKNNESLDIFKTMITQVSELSNKIGDLQNKVDEVISKQNQFSTTYRKIEKLEEKINNIYDTTEEIQETETKTFHKLGKVEMFFDNLDEDKINAENQELKNNVKLISDNLNILITTLNNKYVEQTQSFSNLLTEVKESCEEEPLDDVIEECFPFEELEKELELEQKIKMEISKSESDEEALDEDVDLNQFLTDDEESSYSYSTDEEEEEEEEDTEFKQIVETLEQLPEELQTISNAEEALQAIKDIENQIKEKEKQIQEEEDKLLITNNKQNQQKIDKGLKEGYYTKVELTDSDTNKSQKFYKYTKDISKGEVFLLTTNLQRVGIVRPWTNNNMIDNEDFVSDDDIVMYEGEELWEYVITKPHLCRFEKPIIREFKYISHYDSFQETNEVKEGW